MKILDRVETYCASIFDKEFKKAAGSLKGGPVLDSVYHMSDVYSVPGKWGYFAHCHYVGEGLDPENIQEGRFYFGRVFRQVEETCTAYSVANALHALDDNSKIPLVANLVRITVQSGNGDIHHVAMRDIGKNSQVLIEEATGQIVSDQLSSVSEGHVWRNYEFIRQSIDQNEVLLGEVMHKGVRYQDGKVYQMPAGPHSICIAGYRKLKDTKYPEVLSLDSNFGKVWLPIHYFTSITGSSCYRVFRVDNHIPWLWMDMKTDPVIAVETDFFEPPLL